MKKLIKTTLALTFTLSLLEPGHAEALRTSIRPKPRPPAVMLEQEFNKISPATFRISYSMTFSDVDSLDRAFSVVARPTFIQLMDSAIEGGNEDATSIRTVAKLEASYLQNEDDEAYSTLSTKDKALALQTYANSSTDVDIDLGPILSELIIRDMKSNPSEWKNSLRVGKDHLSFEEKIQVATRLGGDFLGDYNNGRANGTSDANGIISIEEMLENLQNSDRGGVCRDISLAQSQILQELGVPHKNIYNMGYATATGNHAVLVVQDPNDPKRVLRINYDYAASTQNVAGQGALTINGRLTNAGIFQRIYDADGKPVEMVPSDIAKVLREVTGGDSKFESDIKGYTIQKVVLDSKFVDATLFQGETTGTGDQFIGLAMDRTMRIEGTDQYYEVGIAIIDRQGERAEETIDQQMLYARMKYWVEKKREVGKVLFTATVGVNTELALMNTRVVRRSDSSVKEGFNHNSHFNGFAGLEAEFEANGGRTIFSGGVMGQSYMDFQNVAAGNSGGVTPVLDHVNVYTGVDHVISSNLVARGKAILTVREVGNTITFSSAVENRKNLTAFGFSYQKPLDQIPIFFEGSTEVVSAQVQKRWERKGAKKKGSGAAAYADVRRDRTTEENQVGFGLEIKF